MAPSGTKVAPGTQMFLARSRGIHLLFKVTRMSHCQTASVLRFKSAKSSGGAYNDIRAEFYGAETYDCRTTIHNSGMTKKPKCQGLSHWLRVEPPYIPLLYAYSAKLSCLNLHNFAKCSYTCDLHLACFTK